MARRLGSVLGTCVLAATAVLSSAQGAAAAPAVTAPSPAPSSVTIPAVSPDEGETIDGQWIVVFRPGTSGARGLAEQLVRSSGGVLLHTYEHALRGFAARMSTQRAAALRHHPHVLSVEPDQVTASSDTQDEATWGLDRSDQRSLPLDGSYTDGNEGAGVHVYVVDTGVLLGHAEFTGRLGNGFDAVTSGGNANDCNGHGTHVAGTAAGTTYGVADKAVVHPVRVLGCDGSGSNSAVIAGVDWVRANHVKPAVANLSLGGTASTALDYAVNNAISAGVVFAVAAGNENVDACGSSPARAPLAITVGAATSSDTRSSFSNYGTCLDLFAPGSGITSAWHTGASDTRTISGTSMATPHVAGAAALYLSRHPGAAPGTVRDAVVANGSAFPSTTRGPGSPGVLLHTTPLLTDPAPAPEPAAPEAVPAPAVTNGGFESGPQSWTQSRSTIITSAPSGLRPHTGSWAAVLGGANGSNEHVSQTVTVPASGASLSYWWLLTSSEGQNRAYDRMSVRVQDATATYELRNRSNTSARGTWSQDTLDLRPWAGRTVVLRFVATTDSVLPSSFAVDDVTLG